MMPREWQEDLARDDVPRSRIIRIPTGYGKTLGVLGAWLYHRVERNDDRWPRRLVWMLPMRVLVEQTAGEVQGASLDSACSGSYGSHFGLGRFAAK
jgi:CRISPR-associated endonuclease/helicase Cas3